jgi:hypothetical protein
MADAALRSSLVFDADADVLGSVLVSEPQPDSTTARARGYRWRLQKALCKSALMQGECYYLI